MTVILTILFFVWIGRKTLKAHKKAERRKKLTTLDKLLTVPCKGVFDL